MTKLLTSIQPTNTHAENEIKIHLSRNGVKYTTSINATLLFEKHQVLNNVYVWDYDLIPENCATLIHLLAHSITHIDVDYDVLQYWPALLPTNTQ